jgi:DNA-binding MarR family transcriptional regulator
MDQIAAERLSDAFAAIAYHCQPSPRAALSYQAVRALHLVGMDGMATVGEVAAHLGCAQSTASEVVGRLADKGLLQRTRRPHDDRVVELTLTDAGERALRQHVGLDVARLDACLTAMTAEDRRHVERGMAVLLRHLEEMALP